MFLLCFVVIVFLFFFFKQKTAYELRISDWSSDVCSSDLTMKNSSRLLPEIDRKRRRSSSGCAGLRASSITRRLKASHESSRLKKRSGPKAGGDRKSVV